MNLAVSYLGLKLRSPIVVGASPFTDNAESARELQDAGAGAVVMRSIFEEQIYLDELYRGTPPKVLVGANRGEGSYFPALSEYQQSPAQYLRQIRYLKSSLGIPVIASLNGCNPGGWLDFGHHCESEGADAIELNLYNIATDPDYSALDVESAMIETVRQLKASVRIPVAVKLSTFHTALVNFSRELERCGADGIVVFNRFYQPQLEAEDRDADPHARLSDSTELLLRARWVSILSSRLKCSLAVTGGVHSAEDAVKSILAGAHTVQVVSVLIKNGPHILASLVDGVQRWMEGHNLNNLDEFRGDLSLERCPDAAAFERGQYQRLLQNWRI
jgi:dihydroorotate dehydrogenase (fumarate)